MIENAQKNDSKVLEMGSSIRGVRGIHKTQFMSRAVCPEEAGKEIKIFLQDCCRKELEMIENAQKNDSKVLEMRSSIRGVSRIHKTQFMSRAVYPEEAGKEIKIFLQDCCREELEMIENAQKNDSKVLEMRSSI